LPSITVLGLRIGHLNRAWHALDAAGTPQPASRGGLAILERQARALADLASCMPAHTLSDAAVHCALAAETLAEMVAAGADARLQRVLEMLVSAAMVVSQAAAIDAEDIGWAGDLLQQHAARFGALAAVAP
jgi:hypothetical protein